MEFGAATATLAKKLSNSYSVTRRAPYDGVFATPIKLKAPTFSQFDYNEIFGSSGASSSIPILKLPELNERIMTDDFRSSKLDYSKVFVGFENLDDAVPFEELVDKPKEKSSFINGGSKRSKVKSGEQSCQEDRANSSKEIPVVPHSSNDAKRINMSYHKVNQGSENGPSGTTHIAQLHAVPAYTCLIEEVSSVKMNIAKKSIPVARDTYIDSHCDEGIKEGEHCAKSFIDPLPNNAKKQSSNNGGKSKNRLNSVDLFFDACEINNGSDGIHQVKTPPSETTTNNLDNNNNIDSSTAASVAALRKAIEEAQLRIKVAKNLMRRKKDGFPDCVKQKSSIDLKVREKKETKLAYKTEKIRETNSKQTLGEMDPLLQVSSEVGKLVMRTEKVRSDIGDKEVCTTNEAVQEAQKKLNLSQEEHKEEVELKEADHKGKDPELKEAGNYKKVPYIKNTGRKAFEKPEESDHTIEMVKDHREQENDVEKVCANNKADSCEELAHKTKHRCQEVAEETKPIQETLNTGIMDMRLEVEGDKDIENNVTPFDEAKDDYVSNLGEEQSVFGSKENIDCKPEDGKEVKGSIEREECHKKLRAIQELGKGERNVSQEQKESEDKVEVVSELEECELTEALEPIDNEGAFSPHRSEIISRSKEIDNSGCLEDQNRRSASGFLDVNQEVKHSHWIEATESMFRDICVPEILEDIGDHIHNEEEIYERNTKTSDLDGCVRVQDAHASENELEEAAHLIEENESERKDNKVAEVIIETQTDPIYEEIRAEESGNTTEPSSSYEPDEAEKLSNTQVSNTVNENDETLDVAPEFYSCDLQDDIIAVSNASIQHQEKYEEPESVQETNDFCEKYAGQTSALGQGVPVLSGTAYDSTITVEDDSTNVGETYLKVWQNEDECLEKAESDCNLDMFVEESNAESIEICEDAKKARVISDEEINENRSKSTSEEILFDNGHDIEASQIPSMSECNASSLKEEDVNSIHSNIKESNQISMTMEEKKTNGKSHKVEVDKEVLKKIDEAKDRERAQERLAVERAIREARERAFADVKERAALERVAAEARHKNILNGRERLKTTSQANEKTSAEKAAIEAKLKAERAAVERATAEARTRALERALSEKAASDAKNKSDKSVAEKDGGSRGNGTKQNFHSKSSSYSVHGSTEVFDEANGDSAQRCKARSERHHRIGERVAKALAEKSMRDRLVQKEQEERNRVAEALDAKVKRWSSGKSGNLRALLSTLQYILGPDSSWQPIPLTEIVTTPAVKKAYRKATLYVHPDKLQQRGASIQQKYTCEKVFDLLKDAWNRFNTEER